MEFMKEILYKRIFHEELSPEFMNSLLQRIMDSKRLLSDHIDILEQSHVIPIKHVETAKKRKIALLFGTFVLSSMAVVSFKFNQLCLRILGVSAATIYGLFITMETAVLIKNRRTQQGLTSTIKSMDEADTAIRKNISFFRECKILAGPTMTENSCANCLKSISEIIRIIQEVKLLESVELSEHIECMYEPLEDLSTCIYFQQSIEEFTSDDIKTFYNIFLYFQSQYLTRLSLIIFFKRRYASVYITRKVNGQQKNLRMIIEKLNICPDNYFQGNCLKKEMYATRSENNGERDSAESLDLLRVKRSSADILCRFIAITKHYQNTDIRIHSLGKNIDKNQFLSISTEMDRVKESIEACQDDFKTLKLIFDKYLTKKIRLETQPAENCAESLITTSTDEPTSASNHENIVSEGDNEEYFAMRDDIPESDSEDDDIDKPRRAKWSDDWENIDMKVTRSCFAPVLKQLKTKIDPIKEEMKEREMKFLLSRGVDRERIIEFDENADTPSQYAESDSDSEQQSHQRVPKKSQYRYDEVRAFLEQKQQIAFMPFENLPQPSASENVI